MGELRVGWRGFGTGHKGFCCRWKRSCSFYWQLKCITMCTLDSIVLFSKHVPCATNPFLSTKKLSLLLCQEILCHYSFIHSRISAKFPSPKPPFHATHNPQDLSFFHLNLNNINRTKQRLIPIIVHLRYTLQGGQ